MSIVFENKIITQAEYHPLSKKLSSRKFIILKLDVKKIVLKLFKSINIIAPDNNVDVIRPYWIDISRGTLWECPRYNELLLFQSEEKLLPPQPKRGFWTM